MFFKKKNAVQAERASGPVEFLIVGLGNPGQQYEGTRHNVGFLAADCLASDLGIRKIDRLKFKSLCADIMIEGHRGILMKPSTFMNLSGQAVCEAMRFYKLEAPQVVIMLDDVNLEPGRLRIRRKGSDGGQNGMKNIIYLSGRDDFPRIKIGVGKKPHPDYDLAAWVLGRFSPDDQKLVDGSAANAAQAAKLIVRGKVDEAMNLYNTK